jgi:uncharacterized protein YbjT (DUF2867 family)
VKVLVTGGSGFVGSHAVRALVAAGHEPRLLARSPEKARAVVAALGAPGVEVVAGDVTDRASVAAALAGCDAVLHAAAAVEIGRGADVFAANVAGNRNVLGLAAERGLDPIVYTSSVIAMFPPPGPVMTVDDPVASFASAYGRSKSEGGRQARALQAQGLPVAWVAPGDSASAQIEIAMLDAGARHPNCAYAWLQWSLSPKAQAQLAAAFGALPLVPAACGLEPLAAEDACRRDGMALLRTAHLARVPQARCGRGRCVPYSRWTRDYLELLSAP